MMMIGVGITGDDKAEQNDVLKGYVLLNCVHTTGLKRAHRFIYLGRESDGRKRILVLCQACSGQLVEGILKEFSRK